MWTALNTKHVNQQNHCFMCPSRTWSSEGPKCAIPVFSKELTSPSSLSFIKSTKQAWLVELTFIFLWYTWIWYCAMDFYVQWPKFLLNHCFDYTLCFSMIHFSQQQKQRSVLKWKRDRMTPKNHHWLLLQLIDAPIEWSFHCCYLEKILIKRAVCSLCCFQQVCQTRQAFIKAQMQDQYLKLLKLQTCRKSMPLSFD